MHVAHWDVPAVLQEECSEPMALIHAAIHARGMQLGALSHWCCARLAHYLASVAHKAERLRRREILQSFLQSSHQLPTAPASLQWCCPADTVYM
jgi:hypothetical protein